MSDRYCAWAGVLLLICLVALTLLFAQFASMAP